MFPAGSFRHKSMRPPGEYGSNHDLMGSRVSTGADISAFFLFSLLQFLPVSCIIICTWPVSQTVKTLRSQRREYGFESHTGHQSESASIRKDRGAFCMTGGLKRHQGTWGDAHEGVSAPSRKHILHKSHVKDRAGGHGEHHLPFPEVEQRGYKEGDGFRDTMIS